MAYRFPPEWEPHAATWLAWPHNRETWPTRLPSVQRAFIAIIKALHLHERVNLLVNDDGMEKEVRLRLDRADIDPTKVTFHQIPTDDCWLRDTGPSFVKGGQTCPTGQTGLTALCWRFNSWGEKWSPWDRDAEVSARIGEACRFPSPRPGLVLEGGSIETNGDVLLTTESCLLHPKRNPQLKKGDIEALLRDFLGAHEVIWLGGDILAGDDTDGHIDNLARFVVPATVVTPLRKETRDFQLLAKHFRVIPLPSPILTGTDEKPLPASYANFYIANGVVLVPIFDLPTDQEALRSLEPLFPGRRLVPIDCQDLVLGFGGIHCVTQQQPR